MNMDVGIIQIDPNNEDIVIISPSKIGKFADDKKGLDGEIFAAKNMHKPGMYNVDFNKSRIYTINDEQNFI